MVDTSRASKEPHTGAVKTSPLTISQMSTAPSVGEGEWAGHSALTSSDATADSRPYTHEHSTSASGGPDRRPTIPPKAGAIESTTTATRDVAPASERGRHSPAMSYLRTDEHTLPSDEARTAINSPDIEAGHQNSGSCCRADDITVAVLVASTRQGFGVGNHSSDMTIDTQDDGHDFGVEIDGFRGSGGVSGTSSSSGSDKWEALDVTFEGRTATVTSNLAMAEEEFGGGEATRSGSSGPSASSIYRPVAESYGDEESGIMTTPGSNDSRVDELSKKAASNEEEEKVNQNEHSEGDQQPLLSPLSTPQLYLVGLWGRRKGTRHWVDQCARRASSSDDSSSSSACASSSIESSYSETEDACPSSQPVFSTAVEEPLSPLVAPTGRKRGLPSSTGQCPVAGTAAAAQDDKFHKQKNTPKRYRFRQQYQPRFAPQTAQARRIPLSAYGAGDPATAAAALAAERGNQEHNHSIGRGLISPRSFRAFVCCVQLHGCLCEAPLAVLEGIARAPCYLLAAVWVAIVGLVGASAPAQSVNRERLFRQARALAREGALLFAASLTLALPLSTLFTVYCDVSPEDAWDARPVPTMLGAVDPLRFFVFAHGQAGELAANGRPEPLIPPVNGMLGPPFASTAAINNSRTGRHSRASPIWGCSSPGLSFSDRDGEIFSGRHGSSRSAALQSPTRYQYHSPFAAQSMDTDCLGVGILHPPHEVEVRWRRAWASAQRSVVGALRRLEESARTALTTADGRV